jgi:dinuclear metal center YbgI/SA1388 family protein
MKLRDIVRALEQWAPPIYQESYDNSGLLVGDPEQDISQALVALDCVESVVDEAIARGADLIIAHHPIVFGGLKRFNGTDYVQRTVMKAIREGIAIYAIHTNLDNVHTGVNAHLGKLLGLTNLSILMPKRELLEKLVVFAPTEHAEAVRAAMFQAGAGDIGGYSECSFNVSGVGTFKGGAHTTPFVGNKGERHREEEERIEVVLPTHLIPQVVAAMVAAHPYEEVAYDRYALKNELQTVGSGMIGTLERAMDLYEFFDRLKKVLGAAVVKHTAHQNKKIQRVAVCGGSGFFLLGAAQRAGADLFVTSDVKYHQFFDAERTVLADVGHWESEHRTVELITAYLKDKFPKFAVHFSQTNTNPVKYY